MNIRFDPEVAATVEQSPDRTLTACHTDALLTALCEIYCNDPERRTATIALPHVSNEAHRTRTFIAQARNENLIDIAQQHEDHLLLTTSRKTFWQIARPWLKAPASSDTLLRYTQTNGVSHPQRPKNAEGTIYERHFPQIDMTFSLRTADPDADSEVFSEWMNLDRVAYFWDQRGTRAEHAAYLAERREDPHMHPMIGYFDDKPFGYFEFYWAKEDRLGPFYDAGDFDRGLHLLIGDAQFQSAGKLKAWWSGVLHYMFIDDPRTERLVGEPRVDHVRHIAYMHRMGFYTLKEFDFPHKRAALTVMEREKFFDDFRF
ncbi:MULTISPECIES: GNAT family N-acetyltransferase [Caballeronia]|uniref:GNAT family N-acetyltransferase n=1 Tax=Caballeronia TaxID=1827195 RepID=UPI0015894B77|nr:MULTISPECIES: GNAT family N-acetyltransferase [Caballeronia]MCG7401082.1 acetyltransferase [Caballeronia zhejiangensis]MCI1044377.1 acetyltransferase [Caballeronia zhejiangensis]